MSVQGETCAAEVAAAIPAASTAIPHDGPIPRRTYLSSRAAAARRGSLGVQRRSGGARDGRERDPPSCPRSVNETDWTLIDQWRICARRPQPAPPRWWCPSAPSFWPPCATLRRHEEAVIRTFERRKSELRSARGRCRRRKLFSQRNASASTLRAARLGPGLVRCARQHEARLRKSRQRAQPALARHASRAFARPHGSPGGAGRAPASNEGWRKRTTRVQDWGSGSGSRAARSSAPSRCAWPSGAKSRIARPSACTRPSGAKSSASAKARRRIPALRQPELQSVLERGYALVWDAQGNPVRAPEAVAEGQALTLEFATAWADATGGRGQRPRPGRTGAKPGARGPGRALLKTNAAASI